VVSATLYEPILFALLRREGPAPAWDEITAVGRHITARVADGQAEHGARLFCDYWGGPGAWARMTAARRAAVVGRMDDVAWNFEVLFEHAVGPEALAQLDLPIQVLCGQSSPLPARCCSERVARLCADASLILLDGAGHMEPVERPNRVLPLLPFAAARADAAASRSQGVAIAGAGS
jgi:pimeloyl-ACP methyl ester carboxylesterase